MRSKVRKDPRGRTLHKGETVRKNGSYCYTFKDPIGNRRYIYAPDLAALRIKENSIARAQLDGLTEYSQGRATVNDTFDRYITFKYNLKPTTKENYMYVWDHYVRETFGRRRLNDVKFSDVLQYYLHLINDEGLSVSTVDNIHNILHPTFGLAVRDDIIRRNPSDGVMKEISNLTGKNKGIRHALTLEQQRTFMDYIANSPVFYQYWPLFTVMLGTGCRIGEIVGLRWKDVDMKNRMISINHSVVYYKDLKDHQMKKHISKPKTEAGIRTIPMIGAVYDAFEMEKEEQKERGPNADVIDGMKGFIFRNRYGHVYSHENVDAQIKRIVNEYNNQERLKAAKEKREAKLLPMFSAHILRHTFASRLCEQETNLNVIEEIMGHKDIATTMDIYAEVTNERKQLSMDRLMELDIF